MVVVSGRANTSGLGFTPFVEVIELQPGAGNLTVSGVNISAVPFVAKPDFGAYRLMPDGEGGLLVGHTRLPQVFRVHSTEAEYNDPLGSDLRIADLTPAQPWYLRAPNPPISPTHFLRYQGPTPKNNIWELSVPIEAWHRIPDAPW